MPRPLLSVTTIHIVISSKYVQVCIFAKIGPQGRELKLMLYVDNKTMIYMHIYNIARVVTGFRRDLVFGLFNGYRI